MSLVQDTTQIVTQLRSSIDKEGERLKKDLESGIQGETADTTATYEVVLYNIVAD
jgi:hypothetical protein